MADTVQEPVAGTTRRAPSALETAYMRGEREPAVSSILVSSSKYLNSPLYRDTFAQFALRRYGPDVSTTYLIPNMIRSLAECRDDAAYLALVTAERARLPDFAAWLDRRTLTTHRADDLRHHAAGTLGASIRLFVEESGMDMEFLNRDLAPANDIQYILKRRAACHDIEHMVTGFGPNPLGEIALNIINITANARYFSPDLAHYFNEASCFTTFTAIYRNTLHYPAVVPTMMEGIGQAIAAGEALKMPLMLVRWEDYLDWPLDAIARDLGFERGPPERWDFTTEAAAG